MPTSVSKIISYYKSFFDADKHSKTQAKKEGVDQQVILDKWEQTRLESCTKGDTIHKVFYNYLTNQKLTAEENKIFQPYSQTLKHWRNSDAKFICEHSIVNDEYNIIGIPDLIVEKNGTYSIIDFKTNKSIKMSNQYQKMTGMCSQFDCCNYNHYSLQLNFYALLFERFMDEPIKNLSIIHVANNKLKTIPVTKNLSFAEKLVKDYNYNNQ